MATACDPARWAQSTVFDKLDLQQRRDLMNTVQPCELPEFALLRKYLGGGAYADCFFVEVTRLVSHTQYVEAFYTTGVFKLERLILSWFVARPSSDAQAGELARGKLSRFSAWEVEARAPDQLLMCDYQGRTRSWLMCAPALSDGVTRLYFGSAVVPVAGRSGEKRLGTVFRALLGFHKLYSRVLLRAAVARLVRMQPS